MGFNILVVDDTPKNIQVVANLLGVNEEYSMAFATDGEMALEVVNSTNFDLILLDIMMPKLDGFETCKRLKLNEKTKDIPIIFLTAKIEAESISKGFELGGVDYITKPFNSNELIARVKTHLELYRVKKEQDKEIENLIEDRKVRAKNIIESRKKIHQTHINKISEFQLNIDSLTKLIVEKDEAIENFKIIEEKNRQLRENINELKEQLKNFYKKNKFENILKMEAIRAISTTITSSFVIIKIDDYSFIIDREGITHANNISEMLKKYLLSKINIYDYFSKIENGKFYLILIDKDANLAKEFIRNIQENLKGKIEATNGNSLTISAIIKELKNENIDSLIYSANENLNLEKNEISVL